MEAWQSIENAEEEFLYTLSDLGRLPSETSAMLRHCAGLIARLIARNAELEGLLQIVRDTIPHVGGNAASVNELVRRIDAARAEAGHG